MSQGSVSCLIATSIGRRAISMPRACCAPSPQCAKALTSAASAKMAKPYLGRASMDALMHRIHLHASIGSSTRPGVQGKALRVETNTLEKDMNYSYSAQLC